MIPGISGIELLAIAVIMILIIPPKDLPKIVREASRLWVKTKHQISNIRASFDQAVSDELDDVKKTKKDLVDGVMQPLNESKTAIEKHISSAVSAEHLDIFDEADITDSLKAPLETTQQTPQKKDVSN